MSESTFEARNNFDTIYYPLDSVEISQSIHDTVLTLSDIALRFSLIDRVPRYTSERRENDAEHSYMLSLVAQDIAAEFFPDLNVGLVARFAIVHDLLELETGDVPTFAISDSALSHKTRQEHTALEELCKHLPRTTAELLRTYEAQVMPEARFVRMIDKLLPVAVDILGPGSQVMHEDYATFTHDALDRAEEKLRIRFEVMFPEHSFSPLHVARNSLANVFREAFQPASVMQETLF